MTKNQTPLVADNDRLDIPVASSLAAANRPIFVQYILSSDKKKTISPPSLNNPVGYVGSGTNY